jgi:hypothetical protein
MYFGGTYGDGNYVEGGQILSRLYATNESSELVIFKGNDIIGSPGPDRIRLRAAAICFDTYPAASSDPAAENIRMTINESGYVGIGNTTPPINLWVPGSSTTTGIGVYNADVAMILGNVAGGINGGSIQVRSSGSSSTIGTLNYILALNPDGGSVGVGTNNPNAYKFNVYGGAIGVTGTSNYLYYAITNSTSSGAYMLFDAQTAGGSGRKYQIGSSGTGNNPGTGCFELYDATGGATRMVVNASGYVGIGITNPGAVLTVVGGSSTPVVQIHDSSSGGPDYGASYGMVNLTRGADTVKAHVAFIRAGNFVWQMGYIQNTNAIGMFPFNFSGTQGIPTMTWSGGNVGIGTASPVGKLTVGTNGDAESMAVGAWSDRYFCVGQSVSSYSSAVAIGFNNTTATGWIYSLAPSTAWRTLNFGAATFSFFCASTTSTLYIQNGRVGINNTAPGYSFEVNGSMYQQGGNAYLGYDSTNQIFLGLNKTGAFIRLNDDAYFGDPQNGTIQFLNGAGGQWGTLQGYFTNMSTRASKKNVTMFDQTKLESLYQDTIKTKVCSWHYKEEADYIPLKYGPILDDSPPYFTVTPDGESLYINQYVAMLHGALQVAIQKIESLETRLSTLENNTTQ